MVFQTIKAKIPATLIGALSIVILTIGYAYWLVKRQGVAPEEYAQQLQLVDVKFDDSGIPTITAKSTDVGWLELAQAQGFVLASERMWQMDLIRRKAGGRLAEWFGKKAVPSDLKARREDRLAVVDDAVTKLPSDHRAFCDQYANGVNQFIEKFPNRWGIEYKLTGTHPEPWQCRDSLLVVLSMSEMLASGSFDEIVQAKWRKVLPKAWEEFLYTMEHPWNTPYFNARERSGLIIPNGRNVLPARPLDVTELAAADMNEEHFAIGSNSWAWNGGAGSFLANDPHLGQSTPQLWYALRLKASNDDWVAGTALPGIPGIVLGMNPAIAWAFTNVGEDVDDLLIEELDSTGSKYVANYRGSEPVWRNLEITSTTIAVKGDADIQVDVKKTHRGPLLEIPEGSGKFYSRQWLPLKSSRLGLPTLEINRARNWQEFNAAADRFTVPAQNVLMMDRDGNIGYRATGTGVIRQVSGLIPQPGPEGEWLGFQPPVERPRMWIEAERRPTSMATANQRMWVDRFGQHWYGEDRQERITSVLASRNNHTQEQILELQLDVVSKFRSELLRWIAVNGVSKNNAEKEKQQEYLAWDGSGRSNPQLFGDSITAEKMMFKVLLGRVRDHFKPDLDNSEKYKWKLERAWLVALLSKKGSFKSFGLDERELATAILAAITENKSINTYAESNAWQGQHPFVKNVPLIGRLFQVTSYPQYGFSDLVRAEKPDHGPSVRMIWNMRAPEESTWMFPVGQSGHLGSRHYSDLHDRWAEGAMMKVLPAKF